MPLYSFRCPCGGALDELHKWPPPDASICPRCGAGARREVSAPTRTPGRWGDTGAKYVSAFGKVMTTREADVAAREKGLVHEADLPRHFIEDRLESERLDAADHNATMSKFKDLKAQHGDASRAWTELYSVDAMKKAGTLKEDAAI